MTKWYKAPFFKDGQFSKTATFATLANIMVLGAYALGLFRGMEIWSWTIPEFDVGASAAIMALANGTYLGNNVIKRGK